ncbi:uncharacterized protein B0J16DRAFT_346397 [Fusarium flagelliforme]|uniref:uncharacterized protein n=1 Tax=Fusarium flagelliforme TaxID=2675880 RepID=UPI001E8E200E|nr:uncharacterized protein B0J16DRAFT_346397 [Fusarium flagelliforme]KAH7179168.1 hypothetical protein B0J16DRAFT_346397 [Fusarium flagelliforme]
MNLDRMITLSPHSRPCNDVNFLEPSNLPLACPSHHPVSNEVESLVRNYSRPSYRRNSETAIKRLTSMHEDVVRSGLILQRKHFYLSDSESESESEYESHTGPDDIPDRDRVNGIEKDKRGMMDQRGNLKAPDFWSGHDPQVLSLSAMLVHEHYAGQPEDGQLTSPRIRGESWRKGCEEAALKACREVINMHRKKEVDIEKLSMVSMFCIMHNLTIIVKDDASNFACKFAETFRPTMKKYAVRWPFAYQYVEYLERYMGTASHLHDCSYDY